MFVELLKDPEEYSFTLNLLFLERKWPPSISQPLFLYVEQESS